MARADATVRMPSDVRDALQLAALTLSARVGRRLWISDIARADRVVASRYEDALIEVLMSAETEGTEQ